MIQRAGIDDNVVEKLMETLKEMFPGYEIKAHTKGILLWCPVSQVDDVEASIRRIKIKKEPLTFDTRK